MELWLTPPDFLDIFETFEIFETPDLAEIAPPRLLELPWFSLFFVVADFRLTAEIVSSTANARWDILFFNSSYLIELF